MGVVENAVLFLQSSDFFTLGAPALLTISIVYGVISKIDFFDNESVNLVASLSFSAIVIGGIYQFIPAGFIPNFGAYVGVSLIGVLGAVIIAGMAGDNVLSQQDDWVQKGGLVAGVLAFVLTFLLYFPESIVESALSALPGIGLGQDFVNGVIVFSIVGAVVAALYIGNDDGGTP